jgi:hypothetical protein
MEPTLGVFPAGLPWGAWAASTQMPLDVDWALGGGTAQLEILPADIAKRLQRRIRIKWNQPQSKEFTVTLLGTYNLSAAAQKVRLELPRPLVFHDIASARLDVPETLELVGMDGNVDGLVSGKHSVTHMWDRRPVVWDLAWRPFRPQWPVNITADVGFRPRFGHVRELLTWDQPDRSPAQASKLTVVTLKIPSEVKDLRITSGGKLHSRDQSKQLAVIDLSQASASKAALTLEYDFAVEPANGARPDFVAPIISAEQATQTETKVRLWGPPGTNPVLVSTGPTDLTWKDVGLEVVPGRNDLPLRVLQSTGSLAPLTLRLLPSASAPANVVVERALVQVNIEEDGTEQYRARFLITKLNTTSVEVRFPIALKTLDPIFAVDGKEISWTPRDASGLVALLDIDVAPTPRPLTLEVNYQLARGQPGPTGWWQSYLHPPELEGSVFLGKVVWQVTLPPSTMALSASSEAVTQQRWAWHSWLPALEPVLSRNDLEQWICGQEATDSGPAPSLVSSSHVLEPLRVLYLPRAMWFLACSGIVMVVGVVMYAWPPRAAARIICLAAGVALLVLACWFWSELLSAVIYGAWPGLVLLGTLLVLQWMVHQRYQRQLVFMPGFTRVKAGSSLLRPSSANRHREPTTVDAARPQDKSDPGFKSNA